MGGRPGSFKLAGRDDPGDPAEPDRAKEFVARFRELDVLRLVAEAANGELIEAALGEERRT